MNDASLELRQLLDAVRARLEMEQWFGITWLSQSRATAPRPQAKPAPPPPASSGEAPEAPRLTPAPGPAALSSSEKVAKLAELEKAIAACKRCPLRETRKNLVFGEGDPDAEIMFIGEAPGAEEDLQGRPFVGRAGQLLTRIIEAMGLRREQVYISNILKCRPPGNRTPYLTEISCCARHVLQQIKIIRPRIIVALGNIAVKSLLGTEESISALRGKFRDFDGVRVLPTYHPAYLLRNPAAKAEVWEDMKKVLGELKLLRGQP